MKTAKFIVAVLLVVAGFAGGLGYGRWYAKTPPVQANTRRILYYVDPMHPAYKSDKPGIAPDCGMNLEPVYSDDPGGHQNAQANAAIAMPAGAIQIAEDKQQMIGVQYGTVEYTSSGETFRAVGKVATDETRVVRVHSKLDGWIERVQVDFMGALVRKGDPLLTLYSPEMLASQKEYLLALKARDVMKAGAIQSAVESSGSLVEASRRRLELWDLGKAQIDEVERTGTPIRSVTIYSPAAGFITSRNSFPNQRITPETELYAISDLSRVWIMAEVFEADLAKIRIGQGATVRMPYQGGVAFGARVNYVQPQVDPQTRTIKIRLEADNPGMKLKPDMFVDVEFRTGSPRQLTVPADAVLDTGQKQTVFVDRGNGYLEPRLVETGERAGDRVVILKGLQAGDRIVTSANFLVDSESQLKAAMSGMKGAGDQPPHPPAPAAVKHD